MEIKILKKENLRVQGSSLETEEIALVDKLKKKNLQFRHAAWWSQFTL